MHVSGERDKRSVPRADDVEKVHVSKSYELLHNYTYMYNTSDADWRLPKTVPHPAEVNFNKNFYD